MSPTTRSKFLGNVTEGVPSSLVLPNGHTYTGWADDDVFEVLHVVGYQKTVVNPQ